MLDNFLSSAKPIIQTSYVNVLRREYCIKRALQNGVCSLKGKMGAEEAVAGTWSGKSPKHFLSSLSPSICFQVPENSSEFWRKKKITLWPCIWMLRQICHLWDTVWSLFWLFFFSSDYLASQQMREVTVALAQRNMLINNNRTDSEEHNSSEFFILAKGSLEIQTVFKMNHKTSR